MCCIISIIYGWKIDYILKRYTLKQIYKLYEYGYRFDMERRGFKFEEIKESWEDIRKLYYTEEEIRLQKEAIEGKENKK
jgi:hypothetical protein